MAHTVSRRDFARTIANMPLQEWVTFNQITKQTRLKRGRCVAYLRDAVNKGILERGHINRHDTITTLYKKIKTVQFDGDDMVYD